MSFSSLNSKKVKVTNRWSLFLMLGNRFGMHLALGKTPKIPTSVSPQDTQELGERVLKEDRFQEHPSGSDSAVPAWGVIVK